MTWDVIVLILLIVFVASLVRATLGFGDALIAMPLVTMVAGVQTATPLIALTGTLISMSIVWQNWRQIDLRASWQLVLASLLGIPAGLYILKYAPERWVVGALGVFIIGFGAYNLLRPALPELKNARWAYGFGFLAGMIGSAYNTNGPVVITYGLLRRWPPEQFRATLQGYFTPTGLLILLGHAVSGLWTPTLLQTYALALPLVGLAIVAGHRLHRRIPPGLFTRVIYVVLIILGSLLLVQL